MRLLSPPQLGGRAITAAVLLLLGAASVLLGDAGNNASSLSSYASVVGRAVAAVGGEGRDIMSCSARRGAVGGRWEKNLQAAPLMQYDLRWSGVRRSVWSMTYADQLHQERADADAEESSGSTGAGEGGQSAPGAPHRSAGNKFRPPTTYVWREGDLRTEDDCGGPILPLNSEQFCDAAVRLDISRVLFVGDSLALYQTFALLKQIGAEEPTSEDISGTFRCVDGFRSGPKKERRHIINIQHVRNDWLVSEGEGTPLVPRGVKSPAQLRPWVENYLSPPSFWGANEGGGGGGGAESSHSHSGRTLLVVNTGAHYVGEAVPPYRRVVDDFLRDVRSKFLRPDDYVFVRTTPSGHPLCENAIRPYKDEREREEAREELIHGKETYAKKKWTERVDAFGWGFFDDLNGHVREAVGNYNAESVSRDRSFPPSDERNAAAAATGPPQIHLLDVVPMTNLRPDGHSSGPDNLDPQKTKNDCLHYTLPGPTDWWNNLLFANLADLPSVAAPSSSSSPVGVENKGEEALPSEGGSAGASTPSLRSPPPEPGALARR